MISIKNCTIQWNFIAFYENLKFYPWRSMLGQQNTSNDLNAIEVCCTVFYADHFYIWFYIDKPNRKLFIWVQRSRNHAHYT